MEYSLRYYESRNQLNAIILENMIDIPLLQEGDTSFEEEACFIFSHAYEICRIMIKESPVPMWRLPDFYRLARFESNNDDVNTIVKSLTISVVLILTEHFDEKWKFFNQDVRKKMRDYLDELCISSETIELFGSQVRNINGLTACIKAHKTLKRGTNIDIVISAEEFYSQNRKLSTENEPDEKDRRIAELEAKVVELEKNTQISKEDIDKMFQDDDTEQTKIVDSENAERIKSLKEQLDNEKEENKKLKEEVEFHKKEREDMLKELLLTIIHKESDMKEFLELIDGRSDTEIIDTVKDWVKREKIHRKMKNRPLWQILYAAKIYKKGEPNWNAALRKY